MSFLQKKKWRWSETILLSPFRPVTEWGRASLPGEAVGQRAEVVPKSAPSELSRMRTIRLPSRSFGRPLFSIFFFHSLFPISRSARARQERALRPWCCIARGTIQVDQRREEEARLEPEEPVSGQHQLQWQSPRFHPSLDPRSQTGSGCGLCCPSLRHLVNKWLSVCILLVILFFHFHLLSVTVFHFRSDVKQFLNATCPKKVNKLHVFISMAEIDSSIFLEGGGGMFWLLEPKLCRFIFCCIFIFPTLAFALDISLWSEERKEERDGREKVKKDFGPGNLSSPSGSDVSPAITDHVDRTQLPGRYKVSQSSRAWLSLFIIIDNLIVPNREIALLSRPINSIELEKRNW